MVAGFGLFLWAFAKGSKYGSLPIGDHLGAIDPRSGCETPPDSPRSEDGQSG